ncbi:MULTISPECIES: hypothetical protein [Rhizobium/Agrobacterium group]|uniref:hypothetical protein n=1 Tax=Rhizobium/Agrobacterium group TaxID=227290 RepID=UPI0012E955C5|nr:MULTISPECIES: hypothetical protein [Rhizobium/Agrobacterium group]NSZ77374.1 hypothetical protein [Agrobacterium tumefaciens]MCR6727998.1 hypothetical protein [Agrobacterium fabrum]MVA53090.1 hypothetical protein [Agrobacterium vitis]MVA63226.1 hypothetical protein [Agrobacterium vitis]NTG45519.1 hypothetical protein [Rhizobium rhizogenes]
MDGEKQQTGIPQDASAVGRDAERKTHFPPELHAEIATHLHSDNPVETANNLTNFQLAGRQVRDAVQASPVALFHARVNRLGASARALYKATITDDRLPEHPGADPADGPIFPSSRTHSVGPILKFQSSGAKRTFVDHVLDLSEASDQALAIASVARHLGDFDAANRNRLVGRAIDIFRQDESVDTRRSAAQALISGHDHLNDTQKAQILNAIVDHEELAQVYASTTHHRDQGRNIADLSVSGRTPASQGPFLEKTVDAIEKSVDALITDAPISSNEQFHAVRPIAKSIANAYNHARAELVASPRGRENSGTMR